MSEITREEVLHLADLSAISLSDDEVENLRKDLQNIVGFIGELSEIDTNGIEPTYQTTGLSNVFRDDEIKTHLSREELLNLTPDQTNNSIKVPKVL